MKTKEAFFSLSYGIYLVISRYREENNAYIANTVFQVSVDPERFAISCHKENYTAGLILGGGVFSFSVLQKDTPLAFIQKFGYSSGKDVDKFSQLNYKFGFTGVPIVYDYSIAWFECKVEQNIDVGTHWLFVGILKDYGLLTSHAESLDYSWYRTHHKAASPPKAPTYVAEDDVSVIKPFGSNPGHGLPSYACAICEYIYHPSKGDPVSGIDAGTPFEELPDDWKCPICGANKMVFSETF